MMGSLTEVEMLCRSWHWVCLAMLWVLPSGWTPVPKWWIQLWCSLWTRWLFQTMTANFCLCFSVLSKQNKFYSRLVAPEEPQCVCCLPYLLHTACFTGDWGLSKGHQQLLQCPPLAASLGRHLQSLGWGLQKIGRIPLQRVQQDKGRPSC